MNKYLKLTTQILGLFILVYIVIMLLLFAFVKTKNFTSIASKLFYEKTGRQIRMDGTIKLSIFPWPAIKGTNITIYNPKQFSTSASLQYLAKIQTIRVRLKLIDLLHGNVQPANVFLNHADLNLITSQSGETNWGYFIKFNRPLTTDKVDPIKHPPQMISAKQFPLIKISHSSIHFINLQTHSKTDCIDVSLSSPASRELFIREIIFSTQVIHNNPRTRADLRLSTKVHFSPNQAKITLKDLKFLAKWYEIKHTLPKPVALIMRGNVIFHQNQFQARLNGNFNESKGGIILNIQRNNNPIHIDIKLQDLYINPLIIILTGKDWISGTINSSIRLLTSGKTFENYLNLLSGTGGFDITDGKIKGIDINSITKNLAPPSNTSTLFTAFNRISADFNIRRGQLTSNNFLLDTNTAKATGKGQINLPNTSINAKLLVTYLKNPNWQIPITVRGSLFKPTIQPDTSAITKKLLQQNLKKDLGNTLKDVSKRLKGLFD